MPISRGLGISSQALAANINAVLSGDTITQLRDATYLIDIVARAVPAERAQLETLRNLRFDSTSAATERRLRSILLTAAAASLGMIPIAPTVFCGPMAYTVMGGLAVATLLTLVSFAALHVAWFRIKAPGDAVG